MKFTCSLYVPWSVRVFTSVLWVWTFLSPLWSKMVGKILVCQLLCDARFPRCGIYLNFVDVSSNFLLQVAVVSASMSSLAQLLLCLSSKSLHKATFSRQLASWDCFFSWLNCSWNEDRCLLHEGRCIPYFPTYKSIFYVIKVYWKKEDQLATGLYLV